MDDDKPAPATALRGFMVLSMPMGYSDRRATSSRIGAGGGAARDGFLELAVEFCLPSGWAT